MIDLSSHQYCCWHCRWSPLAVTAFSVKRLLYFVSGMPKAYFRFWCNSYRIQTIDISWIFVCNQKNSTMLAPLPHNLNNSIAFAWQEHVSRNKSVQSLFIRLFRWSIGDINIELVSYLTSISIIEHSMNGLCDCEDNIQMQMEISLTLSHSRTPNKHVDLISIFITWQMLPQKNNIER